MRFISLVRLWTETDAEEKNDMMFFIFCFVVLLVIGQDWYGQYRGLDPWDVYSSELVLLNSIILQKLSAGELPQQSSHQCDQSSTSSCGDGFFCDESNEHDLMFLSSGQVLKRELVNIWNSKLRKPQGECTCYTQWGVKRRICTNKNSKLLRFWDKMEGLSRDYS
ncbi:hypothetical protein KY285_034784 [Solanum tuberosum]|nr:hypothetical protein KY285_034784 [Solanum tuberosum]